LGAPVVPARTLARTDQDTYGLAMGGRDIIVLVCGLVVATALTIFGTVKAVDWLMPSDRYGPGRDGTGVLSKTK
jgi:hypothetical protein